jgi:hypothetical protein
MLVAAWSGTPLLNCHADASALEDLLLGSYCAMLAAGKF